MGGDPVDPSLSAANPLLFQAASGHRRMLAGVARTIASDGSIFWQATLPDVRPGAPLQKSDP